MMRNPSWSRDELILALQLYHENRASPPDIGHPRNIEVVGILAKLHRLLGTPPFRHVAQWQWGLPEDDEFPSDRSSVHIAGSKRDESWKQAG